MKKIRLVVLGCVLICFSPWSMATQTNNLQVLEAKMDQAEIDLSNPKNTPNAWELTVEIARIVKEHPESDDGEFAEGIIDVVARLLTK
ncbi:MAG: hypothetical protein ACRCXC_00430 [Legionella sp.]